MPRATGIGHAVYWTRAGQIEVARLASRIYREIVQAVDHIYEEIERHAAIMLDADRETAERTAAWAEVRRLHTPPSETVRGANFRAAVATVRARTDPPDTDLAAVQGVHADRLRAAGERRLRWLLGPSLRAIGSQEIAALERIESTVRNGELRIGRAATAARVRTACRSALAVIEGVRLGASPRWRVLAGAGALVQAALPAGVPVTLLAVPAATPPFRAAVLEAWTPPATPDRPETAGPVLIEHAASSDPAALRATVARGASVGIDRLELDWLVRAPAAPVTVEATARSAFGPRDVTLTVPVPTAPAAT